MNNQLTRAHSSWTRSEDGIIAGVCQVIAERFEVDPWIVRIGLLVAVLAFGTGIIAYAVLAFTLPRESEAMLPPQKKFLGVCKKLSEMSGIDLGIVRALTVFTGLASFGVTLLAYFILYFVFEQKNGGDAVI